MEQHQSPERTAHAVRAANSGPSSDGQTGTGSHLGAPIAVSAMEHPPSPDEADAQAGASAPPASTDDASEGESDTLVELPVVRVRAEGQSPAPTFSGAPARVEGRDAPAEAGLESEMQASPVGSPPSAAWRPQHETTLVFSPHTAAGVSYLFWWVSGLIVYFNERENRFVRFHAVQSILLTGALTVLGVATLLTRDLLADLTQMTGVPIYMTLGQWEAVLGWLLIAAVWLGAMVAAWSGHYFRLPYLGRFADRYSVPFPVAR